jgi:CAAX protease family protein
MFDLRAWVRKATLQQWALIDETYRKQPLPDLRAAAVLVTAAICLVIPKYFGSPESFHRFPWLQQAFAILPYPDLHPHLFWASFKIVHYGLLPWLCIRFVLRSNARAHGLRLVWEPKVWALYLGMLAVVLPLAYLAAGNASFLRTYPKYAGAGDSLEQLLLWEGAYAFQFLMLEFFFRGFLIFALSRFIGSLAIFVMVIPYAMIHLAKPLPECLGAIVTGIVLGTVALRTGSISGGVIVHSLIGFSMDFFALSAKGKLANLHF